MEIWKAIILGIVQGFTEFLPVSSSGHLIFFQKLLNVDLEAGEMFLGVMLHVGTLISLFILFFKDILGLFKNFKMLMYVVIASIPAAFIGLLFGDTIDKVFYGGEYLCYGFLITAIILYATEIISKKYIGNKKIGLKSSIVMGFCQAVAVLPGISRSGSTIAGGTAMRVNRNDNANFSFIMSIPVIGGAALVEIYKQFVKGSGVPSEDLAAVFI
jgi:undecaprenyl-diphosphatase